MLKIIPLQDEKKQKSIMLIIQKNNGTEKMMQVD